MGGEGRTIATSEKKTADVIVVGGGMFGAAIAFGLARAGVETIVLDGADDALRAARGNFGLVWVQSKGLGFQPYNNLSRESSELWYDLAADLKDRTGIDVAHRNKGGIQLLIGDAEREKRAQEIEVMRRQAAPGEYQCEIVDRRAVQEMMPDLRLGQDVVGGSFCPYDGHVNPLRMLRALHVGLVQAGGRYLARHQVRSVEYSNGTFTAVTDAGRYQAAKIVMAAGHGNTALCPQVGLNAPIRPQRGQVLITERVEARIAMAMNGVRQTDEGGFQLGSSEEDIGFNDGTTMDVTCRIAARAVCCFPQLANVRLVRTWGCVRVLTPDKCAIMDESESHPGAYVVTSHSGVTLGGVNAGPVAQWIATGDKPARFDAFTPQRYKGRYDGRSDVSPAH